MKSAAAAVAAMVSVALLLLLGAVTAVWRAFPEVEDSTRAAYHALAGLCRHPFRANGAELITAAALTITAVTALIVVRFAADVLRQGRRTRRQVRAVLDGRTIPPPAAVSATASGLGVTRCLDVVRHPAPFAFCYGFLRPRICLSSGLVELLTPEEVAAVLLHEDHHRRRRDPLALLLAGALTRALFFLPTLRDLHGRYDAIKEFAADHAAVRRVGVEPVAGALYKVLSSPLSAPDMHGAAIGGLSVTERRIDHLLAPRHDHAPALSLRRLVLSALAFSTTGLVVLALTAVHVQPMVHVCRA